MDPMNKEMLRLALPSILANLTVPLVGMVDIAIAGHLDTSAAALIGGISVGSLMFDLLYWNFGFLRAGTGGMTAQAFGRQDWKDCAGNLTRGVGLAFLIAVVLIALQWPFQKLIFLFVGCSEEVRTLALEYFYIRIWAAPATLCLMAFRGWFIGMQDTFSSMLADVIVNGGNILFSLLLAFGIPGTGFNGLGFKGIAWGTVAAQYSGLLFASGRVALKFGNILAGRRLFDFRSAFAGGKVGRFFSVNRDLFIRSVCLIIVYLAFTAISARFGDTLLAACSIMLKLLMVFSYFTDGFAFAGEALTGRFTGMRDLSGVRRAVRYTFIWSMGIGLIFIGIYSFAGVSALRLMTSDASVVEAARAFIPWLVFIPLVGCPAFTWDGIYTGATATRAMRDSNIGCVLAFFAIWFSGIFILAPSGVASAHLLFAAYYAHLIYRSLYQTVFYRRSILAPLL
jgi:multidrug resistance protein, MATE family